MLHQPKETIIKLDIVPCYSISIFSTNSNTNSPITLSFLFHFLHLPTLKLTQTFFNSALIPTPFHTQSNSMPLPSSTLSSLTVSPSPLLSFSNTLPLDTQKIPFFSSKKLFHFPALLSCGTPSSVLIPLRVFLMGLVSITPWFVLVLGLMITPTLLF